MGKGVATILEAASNEDSFVLCVATNGVVYGSLASFLSGLEFRGAAFQANLDFGLSQEDYFCKYLNSMGVNVTKFSNASSDINRGPTMFVGSQIKVAPDRLIFTNEKFSFLEIKSKRRFSVINGEPVVGIDKHYFLQYMEIADTYKDIPFSLVFIITDGSPDDIGAYIIQGRSTIEFLSNSYNDEKYKGGMIYFEKKCMRKILNYVVVKTINRAN